MESKRFFSCLNLFFFKKILHQQKCSSSIEANLVWKFMEVFSWEISVSFDGNSKKDVAKTKKIF